MSTLKQFSYHDTTRDTLHNSYRIDERTAVQKALAVVENGCYPIEYIERIAKTLVDNDFSV